MNIFPPALAFIEGIGGPELLLVMFIILLLFGGEKLPVFAKTIGKTMRELKKASADVERELKKAMEETPETPPPAPYRSPYPTVPTEQVSQPALPDPYLQASAPPSPESLPAAAENAHAPETVQPPMTPVLPQEAKSEQLPSDKKDTPEPPKPSVSNPNG